MADVTDEHRRIARAFLAAKMLNLALHKRAEDIEALALLIAEAEARGRKEAQNALNDIASRSYAHAAQLGEQKRGYDETFSATLSLSDGRRTPMTPPQRPVSELERMGERRSNVTPKMLAAGHAVLVKNCGPHAEWFIIQHLAEQIYEAMHAARSPSVGLLTMPPDAPSLPDDTGWPDDAELARRLEVARERRQRAWAEWCDANAHEKRLLREAGRRIDARDRHEAKAKGT